MENSMENLHLTYSETAQTTQTIITIEDYMLGYMELGVESSIAMEMAEFDVYTDMAVTNAGSSKNYVNIAQ